LKLPEPRGAMRSGLAMPPEREQEWAPWRNGTGHVGLGSGIGGGAGAAVGILATMMTRGNDVVFPAGTTLEMVLARPLNVQQDQLSGMPGSTE